jgi:hypothetical protein
VRPRRHVSDTSQPQIDRNADMVLHIDLVPRGAAAAACTGALRRAGTLMRRSMQSVRRLSEQACKFIIAHDQYSDISMQMRPCIMTTGTQHPRLR